MFVCVYARVSVCVCTYVYVCVSVSVSVSVCTARGIRDGNSQIRLLLHTQIQREPARERVCVCVMWRDPSLPRLLTPAHARTDVEWGIPDEFFALGEASVQGVTGWICSVSGFRV